MQGVQGSASRSLPSEVLRILRCPSCQGFLAEAAEGLRCAACSRLFPKIDGVVRFVDSQWYAANFGFEWQQYARTQLDRQGRRDSEESFRRKTGFAPHDLAGKLVLDVGCGMGRYADVASRWGAHVVGVDLSEAAVVAASNLGGRDFAVFFQADVFALPFAESSFDFIYSLGVLHHTPDCRRAFEALPKLLKPGGTVAIWLYSGYNRWYRFSDLYRHVTSRLSPKVLHPLCRLAVPLYYVYRGLHAIPLIGRPLSATFHHLLPFSLDPDPEWRVLDTYDWYSPRFQSKHTYEEVFRWFEGCGLERLRVLLDSVSVTGRRPEGLSAEGEAALKREAPSHPLPFEVIEGQA